MAASTTGGAAAEKPPPATGGSGRTLRSLTKNPIIERVISLREGSIIVVTIITAIYFSANTSSFFTGDNFKTLLPYFAPFAILAAGEIFVMILGEIDLSIAAMYLFAPILFYKLNSSLGLGLVPSVIVALLCCMAVGALNGFFVAVVGINSFVATLAMLFTFEGLALIVSHGTPVSTPGGQQPLDTFGKVFGGGTYAELIWAVAIIAILQVVLTFTRWGLYTVAIGSNKLGAAEAGVKVAAVTIRNFMLCSLTAGLAGIFDAVRSGTVQPDPSGPNEYLFLAVAAAVIGGTLLTGGSGTVVGALIGALFLGVLKDGLILQGVNANYLLFYTGIAIFIAMTANVFVGRVRRGHSGSG
ncbi:MAG TPA: ABC transporter permease [Solirubrobacteraceae bacterium]|nr:ABC transporter permease [Solirubrobacteraceae bacterium]